jgi:hypothetical protein
MFHPHRPRRLSPAAVLAFATALLTLLLGALTARPGAASPGDTIPDAIQKGATFLAADVVKWSEDQPETRTICAACHRHGITLFGLSQAESHGIDVETTVTGRSVNAVEYLADLITRTQQPDGQWNYAVSGTSYAMFAAAGYDLYGSSGRMAPVLTRGASWAVTQQNSNGRWAEDNPGSHPPDYGSVATTGRLMVGVAQALRHVDPNSPEAAAYTAALNKAAAYMVLRKADGFNATWEGNPERMDQIFKIAYGILGLTAVGKTVDNSADLAALRDRILNGVSRSTGRGWGIVPNSEADPFNTGIALFALSRVGVTAAEPKVQAARAWLAEVQLDDAALGTGGGYWNSSPFSTFDTYSTFAVLGLSVYGDGVRVQSVGGQKTLLAGSGSTQTAVFDFQVTNANLTGRSDTYHLRVRPPAAGWTAELDRSSLTLDAGASGAVRLTVTAPANLWAGIAAEIAVVAISEADAKIQGKGSARLRTEPNLAPPAGSGNPTLTQPEVPGGAALVGQPVTLAATVTDLAWQVPVQGPNAGIVAFVVDGTTVGFARNPDENGRFTFQWTPSAEWFPKGGNSLRAVYSGIDRTDEENQTVPDHQPSTGTTGFDLRTGSVSLTGISPAVGHQGETLDVTLTGTGLSETMVPKLGGGIGVTVLSATSTELRARLVIAPNLPPAVRSVTIDAGNDEKLVLPRAFTVEAAMPAIDRLEPAAATTGETREVIIHGSGFLPGAQVALGDGRVMLAGEPEISYRRIRLQVEIPYTAAPGPLFISVTNPSGTVSNPATFEILPRPAPEITSVTPSVLYTGGTTEVVIAGRDFLPGATVALGGGGVSLEGEPTVTASEIRARVAVAMGAEVGGHSIDVHNPDGQSASSTFEVRPLPPVVLGIAPAGADRGATLDVRISGSNFQPGLVIQPLDAALTINGELTLTDSEISANVTVAADAALGAHTLRIVNPDGGTADVTFTVTETAVTVTEVTPNKGRQGATVQVTLRGTRLMEGAAVSFGAGVTVAGAPTYVSETEIRAKVKIAPTAALGVRTVTVTNPDGSSGSKEGGFRVLKAGPALRLSRPTVVFKNPVALGKTSRPEALVLTNGGGQTLTGTITRPKAPFRMQKVVASFTLKPGESMELKLLFSPKKTGISRGSFVITSNDSLKEETTVKLIGRGTRK